MTESGPTTQGWYDGQASVAGSDPIRLPTQTVCLVESGHLTRL